MPKNRICMICNLESNESGCTEAKFFKSLSVNCRSEIKNKWGYDNFYVFNLGNAKKVKKIGPDTSMYNVCYKALSRAKEQDDLGIDFLFIVDNDVKPYKKTFNESKKLFCLYKKGISSMLNSILNDKWGESRDTSMENYSCRLVKLPEGQAIEFIIANSIVTSNRRAAVTNADIIKNISAVLSPKSSLKTMHDLKARIIKEDIKICEKIMNYNAKNNETLLSVLRKNLESFYRNLKEEQERGCCVITYLDLFVD